MHLYNKEVICDRKSIHAVKTVTSIAAEIFSGSSRLEKRKKMIIYNDGSSIIYYSIGNSGITTTNGIPIEYGNYEIFYFNPDIPMPIYCITSSTNSNVRVCEM